MEWASLIRLIGFNEVMKDDTDSDDEFDDDFDEEDW